MRAGWTDSLLLVPVFLRYAGLFRQHHGNVVTNRVDAPARSAFQSGLIRKEFHLRFAHRANQDVESKFWNTQESLLGIFAVLSASRHSTKRLRSSATSRPLVDDLEG